MPEPLELFDVSSRGVFSIRLFRVGRAKLGIGYLPGQNMIRNLQEPMRDRDHRFLMPPMPHYPTIASRQRRLFSPDRRQGGFGQRHAQPGALLAGFTRQMPAGTLVVTRTESGPTCQMPRTGEWLHGDPDLRHDDLDGAAIDARDGV